jgi:hypothetical protein
MAFQIWTHRRSAQDLGYLPVGHHIILCSLAYFSANGDMNDVLVLHEMKEIKAAIEIEKVSNSASWGSFFGSAANRRRIGAIVLVGAATQLAGNGEFTST